LSRFSSHPSLEKKLAAGGFTSMVLLLVGQILVVPPYEGFDETAHYSYISYLSDEGAIPWIGQTRFDRTLADDLSGLPRPYSTVPPLEQNGGLTYRSFHQDVPDSSRTQASSRFRSKRASPARFEQDMVSAINGAASHPPLYYSLLVLPYRLSAEWSPQAQLLFLRLLSIGLACSSYWFFFLAVRLFDDDQLRLRLLGGSLLALHLASLVFEFGRIGNDSLVVLLFAVILYLLVRLARGGMTRTRDFVWLGLVLGLGLMTKLYFVATLAAVLAHIVYSAYAARIPGRPLLARTALLAAIAVLVGGWWYALFNARYGVFFGTHLTLIYAPPEAIELGTVEFILRSLRMFASAVSTFVWSGSWSFLRRTVVEYLLCAPFFLVAMWAFLRGWKTHTVPERLAHSSAAVLLGPMVGGTAWYVIDAVHHGVGTTVLGGYYWLVAWPAFAVIFSSMFKVRWARQLLPTALALMVFFELLGWWKQLLLYSGLLAKIGEVKEGVGLVAPGLAVLVEIAERLALLSWPLPALAAIVMALLIRTGILIVLIRDFSRENSRSPTVELRPEPREGM